MSILAISSWQVVEAMEVMKGTFYILKQFYINYYRVDLVFEQKSYFTELKSLRYEAWGRGHTY